MSIDKKKSSIGGQALLEGVMMKSPTGIAMVVRKADGSLQIKYDACDAKGKKYKFLKLPIVRGCVNFVESLQLGMTSMSFAAEAIGIEEEQPTKFELWLAKTFNMQIDKIISTVAIILAVFFSAGLFIALPSFLGSVIGGGINHVVLTNLIEGVTRIVIFLAYMILVSLMKDIKRVYMYHGAEHKTIACYEADKELTVENARECTRFHARCGTNYLFLVMMVSIIFFSLLGFNGHWALKILVRLICLPIVAGLSYEVLKAAANSDSLLARIVRWPGVKLQKLTTREPDDDMLEVAIAAFELANDPEAYYAKEKEKQAVLDQELLEKKAEQDSENIETTESLETEDAGGTAEVSKNIGGAEKAIMEHTKAAAIISSTEL